jgi:hypothetical protein
VIFAPSETAGVILAAIFLNFDWAVRSKPVFQGQMGGGFLIAMPVTLLIGIEIRSAASDKIN